MQTSIISIGIKFIMIMSGINMFFNLSYLILVIIISGIDNRSFSNNSFNILVK